MVSDNLAEELYLLRMSIMVWTLVMLLKQPYVVTKSSGPRLISLRYLSSASPSVPNSPAASLSPSVSPPCEE